MSMVIVTSNEYDREYDLTGVTNAYFVVVSPKPFETKWNAFKIACRERFVKPHIVFMTPLIEHPIHTSPFLFHYGLMLGYSEEIMRVYG
jgi:hypothetical protein